MRVYLMGFMGCGKTTYGKLLAKKLNYSFKDLDKLICEEANLSIPAIFDQHGESYFRALETNILQSTTQYRNTVIALGGGTPCSSQNIESIGRLGISIYLDASPEILYGRLKHLREGRPLIANMTDEVLKEFIYSKLEERLPFYLQATHIVSADKKGIETLEQILAH